MTGTPFYLFLYATCVALMAVCDLWLVWQRKARHTREHPTTYLSPEERARGEGLRSSRDRRWVIVEAWPLSAQERYAIDRALAERCRKREMR